MQGCSIVPEQLRCLGKNHNLLGGTVYSLDWTSTGLTQTAVRDLIQGRTEVGTNSRNGAERNGTAKTRNSRGTLQFRSRWSKLAARVLRLRLLPPDGQISGSTYTGISSLVEGSLLTQLQ